MIIFQIAGFLTDFTGGQKEIPLPASPATVGEALDELWKLHRGLQDRIVNERGQIRPHVNIFVNADNIRLKELLATPLSDHSEITILPAVSGGR